MSVRQFAPWTALLLLLAGCQPPASVAPPAVTAGTASPGSLVCRDDVDGAAITADRGIGGTGVSARPGDQTDIAERGIGGTGIGAGAATAPDNALAERGIGGTGIAGAITGFASVCINGLEVGIDRPVQVSEDGTSLHATTLHLGQVASIEAGGAGQALRAITIAIHHEVSGPIESMARAANGQVLDVAGQRVVLDADTRTPDGLHAGDWVAVSGLRDPSGDIRASRIDRRPPGKVVVIGQPVHVAGKWRLGTLQLRFNKPPPAGQRVALTGDYTSGTVRVETMTIDGVMTNMAADRRLVVEGFASTSGRSLTLGQGIQAEIGPAFGAPPPVDRPAVVEFLNDGLNGLIAVGWHAASMHSGGSTHSRHAPLSPSTAAAAATSDAATSQSAPTAEGASDSAAGVAAATATSSSSSGGGGSDGAGSGSDGAGSGSDGASSAGKGASSGSDGGNGGATAGTGSAAAATGASGKASGESGSGGDGPSGASHGGGSTGGGGSAGASGGGASGGGSSGGHSGDH